MILFHKVRNFIFGSRSIAIGHTVTSKGSSVLMIIGRKRVGLTPAGARKIADQLQAWADHAENTWRPIQTMKWIVAVTTKDEVEKAAAEWVAAGLDKAKEAQGAPK